MFLNSDLLNKTYNEIEDREGIVLFTDIRGYTKFVAKYPTHTNKLLNIFKKVINSSFSKLLSLLKYDFLVKPLGDGMMIVWLMKESAQSKHDVITEDEILEIAKKCIYLVDAFPKLTKEKMIQKFDIGFGISAGNMLLHKVGKTQIQFYQKPSTIYDFSASCINLAARLQGMAKPNGVFMCFDELPEGVQERLSKTALIKDKFSSAKKRIRGVGTRRVEIYQQ